MFIIKMDFKKFEVHFVFLYDTLDYNINTSV